MPPDHLTPPPPPATAPPQQAQGRRWTAMQATSHVKIVPRVIFELDQAGLQELLIKPKTAARLLVSVCKKHSFDGLVGALTHFIV